MEKETTHRDAEKEKEKQQRQLEMPESAHVESTDKTTIVEHSMITSLVQSLLIEYTEGTNDKTTKKEQKPKSNRQKEFEYLTNIAETILHSPKQLNAVCERINSLLVDRKTSLHKFCRSLDTSHCGGLSYEQFKLVIKDQLPEMSIEDIFILAKLFEINGVIDYRTMLDQRLGDGILQYITSLPTPQSNEIILEKSSSRKFQQLPEQSLQSNHFRYVTLQLRLIIFDSYDAYPGHIHFTVPDHTSIYALSKMIIDETDLPTRSVHIFREKHCSRHTLLNPMHSLENCCYRGVYADGTHYQSFPTYTLYYDYLPTNVSLDCPIVKYNNHMT